MPPGFVVDVADSGIDNGTATPGHFGLYRDGDTSQSSRVAYTRLKAPLHQERHAGGLRWSWHAQQPHHRQLTMISLASNISDSAGYSYGVGDLSVCNGRFFCDF